MVTFEIIDKVMEATGAKYEIVRDALTACGDDPDVAIHWIREGRWQKANGWANDGETIRGEYKEPEPEPGTQAGTESATESAPEPDPKAKAPGNDGAILDDILDAIKEVWRKGNASRLIITKNGEVILNLSLVAGAIGLLLAPVVFLLGTGAAVLTDYKIEILLDNGDVININQMVIKRKKEEQEGADQSRS